MSDNNIILLFTVQGTCIGIIGTIFGTSFGYLLTKKINWIVSTCQIFEIGITLPIYIDIYQIITIIIVSISISFLATLYPAKLATTINPSEVLRHE